MTSLPQKISWQRWATWGIWLLIFLVIIGDVIRHPTRHTTTPTYDRASILWWAGQDPYNHDAHGGFFYFPQAAFLYTPFTWGPPMLGEILWRLTTFGLFFYALTRLNQFFLARDDYPTGKTFFILSLLALPSSWASLRNAQFDLPLAALLVLTTAEIACARWNAATIWLCLAVALKPLAVVPLLLFTALYWKLIPRLIAGLLIVIALPFLHWNPAFAAHEYARCFEALAWAGTQANEPRYSELGALISHVGIYPPDWLKTLARIIFALACLGLGFAAGRRLSQLHAAWVVGALSADYLMLFNPRTETCSYVFLGPFVASLAVFYLLHTGRKALAWFLVFSALGFACDAIPKVDQFSIHDMTDRWLKPLLALFFLPILIQFIFERRPPADCTRANYK